MTKNFLKALTLSAVLLTQMSAMDLVTEENEKTNLCETSAATTQQPFNYTEALNRAVDSNAFDTINNIFAGTHTKNQPLLGKETAKGLLKKVMQRAFTNGNLALHSLLTTVPLDWRISQCVARYILYTIVTGLNNGEFSVSVALNFINSHVRNRADGIILTGSDYPDKRFLGGVLAGLGGLDEATINKEFLLNLFRPTPLFRLNSMPQGSVASVSGE
jgi:hypothetical protein